MSIEENKAIVESYFTAQRKGNLMEGLEVLADDSLWIVPGNWEMAGTFTKPQMAKMMESLNMFEGGLNFDHLSVTAEEDRVAIQTVVSGKLKDSREYRNNIFFLFRVKNGKVQEVTEVVDSLYSRQFWLGK